MKFLTKNAILYTIKNILKISGVGLTEENLINIYENKSVHIHFGQKSLKFCISADDVVMKFLNGTLEISYINTYDNKYSIPIILNTNTSFATFNNNVLEINADIISISFIILSRFEESIIKERDNYGRFEFKNSLAYKYNFIDFPIIDEYAMILRSYIKLHLPEIKIHINNYSIVPTHDIDEIERFSSFWKTIKTIIGDIIIYKSIRPAIYSTIQFIKTLLNKKNDPYLLSIEQLNDLSKRLNLTSVFFFMGALKSNFDSGYNIEISSLKSILKKINDSKMVIGIHGSFYSYNNIQLFKEEITRLESYLTKTIDSSRQHFLRFDVFQTIQTIETIGLRYDYTLGYAEMEGFRCGTCHEFHTFDLQNDRQTNIIERPLIVMDTTLTDYRKFSVEEAYLKVEKLFNRCKAVEGNFVILWHNRSVARNKLWYKELYEKFLISNYK